MPDTMSQNLNSFLIRQASSCPLKLQYSRDYSDGNSTGNNYKIKTKIMMRRVLGIIYQGGKEAADDHRNAIHQTKNWLKAEQVTIYGGVIAWKNYHARLPVLVKDGQRVTLLQIHGKMWKSHKPVTDFKLTRNKKLTVYVREAAYKKWLIRNIYPELDLSIRLCFPSSDFKSGTDNLYAKVAKGEATPGDVDSLYTEVNVDKAIDSIINADQGLNLHPFFHMMSFEDQLDWMGRQLRSDTQPAPFQITNTCKVCRYRTNISKSSGKGCWETHLNGTYKHPEQHVFDLIGHGNSHEAERDRYFQEEVPLPAGITKFSDISVLGNQSITIQQRRILQLLSARGKLLPLKWMKEKLREILKHVKYPLHFIDFEAATSAIPMQVSGRPYEPVYFQFSCHTLHENGELTHYEWLDTDLYHYPHDQFVDKLTSIPGIMKGTIFQYSPFEKQALNTLFREYSRSSGKDIRAAMKLQSLIKGADNTPNRFVDMNKLVRDFYFNRFLNQGLGLKQVLMSTLQSSTYLQKRYTDGIQFGDFHLNLIESQDGHLSDPYILNQTQNEPIEDGSSAMHAWLYAKTEYCDDLRRKDIQDALRVYCSLDSLALVIIFQEWMHLISNCESDGDIIEWD